MSDPIDLRPTTTEPTSADPTGTVRAATPSGTPAVSGGAVPDRVRLATYDTYPDAQEAVDHLSDRGFPVATAAIVWSGLRRVEQVTGRRTILTAALEGAVAGGWFGTLIGFVMAALSAADAETSDIGIVFTFFVVGAIGTAIWRAVEHAMRRGRRDFASITHLEGTAYELWVESETAPAAADLLGVPRPS